MKLSELVCAALVCFGIVVGALPASGDEPKIEKAARQAWGTILKEMDTNNDGKLSRREFVKMDKNKTRTDEKFRAMDTNKDGFVVEREYVAWVEKATKNKKR